jgi:hypothetical protein
VGEIEGIKERLRDFYLAFAHAIAGIATRVYRRGQSFPRLPNLVTCSWGLPLKSQTPSILCWAIWTDDLRPCPQPGCAANTTVPQ